MPGGSQIWWTETSSNPLANRLDVLIARHDLESGERTQRRLDSSNQKRIPRLVLSPDRAWLAVDDFRGNWRLRRTDAEPAEFRTIWPDTKNAFVQPLAVSQNGRYLFVWEGDPPRWAILDARTLTAMHETFAPNIFLTPPRLLRGLIKSWWSAARGSRQVVAVARI